MFDPHRGRGGEAMRGPASAPARPSSWQLRALSASLLPASLFEEVRCVVAPVVMAQYGVDGSSIATGVAHTYFVELILAIGVAHWCGRRQALGCGRLVLVAGWLNLVGMVTMALSEVVGGLHMYLCGHVTFALGSMIRDVALPALTTCFPVEEINQLNAFRRAFVHIGALLGGALISAGLLRAYCLVQAAGLALSLRTLSRVLPHLKALDCPAPPGPKRLPACGGFLLLVLARFLTSAGIVSTSGAVMLSLLRARMPQEQNDLQATVRLMAGNSVVGHVAGTAVNVVLGWSNLSYGLGHVVASTALYTAALACYPAVASARQYFLVTVLLRGARTLSKAASDAIAFRAAKELHEHRSAALVSRRIAFKLGQLAGKYSVVPLLAIQDTDVAFHYIFGMGAATSIIAAVLHLPACIQYDRFSKALPQ